MTFDLIAWPVDRPLTTEEAVAAVRAMRPTFGFRLRTDRRIDRFVKELDKRYPGVASRFGSGPFEFDVSSTHVFIGIPWAIVDEVTQAVGDCAWAAGLALFDPQRRVAAMPAPFADLPMSWEGIEKHVDAADTFFATVGSSVAKAKLDEAGSAGRQAGDEAGGQAGDKPPAAPYRMATPLAPEVVPPAGASVVADATRTPPALQTPDHRAELIRALDAAAAGTRHDAVTALAGWDPDPEVVDALRSRLTSDDVFLATTAANGLGRQGDVASLGAVLDLVRSLSPADGGSAASMALPLGVALRLAAIVGPDEVERVRALGREWLGADAGRARQWDREARSGVEALLAADPAAREGPAAAGS